MNLDPKVIKMRDALIERIENKSSKEVANIVNEILLNETNSINRLAALSARVEILKRHIKNTLNIDGSKKIKKNIEKFNLSDESEKNENATEEENITTETNEWTRVEMLKSGVVNGVRFPEGVVIDVNKTDSLFTKTKRTLPVVVSINMKTLVFDRVISALGIP